MEARRLLLFVCLKKQTTNANDHKTKLKNFGCTHLRSPPFPGSGGKKRPLSRGTNRLPLIGSARSILPESPHFVNSRRRTSPPRSARHLPLTRGGFSARTQGSPCQGEAFPPAPKAPLVKGSWRAAPERLLPPQRAKAPLSGVLSAQQTERLPQICHNLSASLRSAPPLDKGRLFRPHPRLPLSRGGFSARTQGSPCQGELARSA